MFKVSKNPVLITAILWSVLVSYGVTAQESSAFQSAVVGAFSDYYSRGTYEKVYLHTDREVYAAGDTLWFKAYVTEGVTDLPLSDSRFVYVELRGPGAWHQYDQKMYERVKVRKHLAVDSTERFSVYDNRIEIPADVTPGVYTLYGYTEWMYNHPTDYMFAKRIEVRHPDENYAVEHVNYRRLPNGRIVAEISVTSSQGTPLTVGNVSTDVVVDGKLTERSYSLREGGVFNVVFAPPTSTECNYIDITYDSPQIPAYRRRIELPSFKQDFDVAFLPEGGNLLVGIPQRVAFKAVGTDGLSIDVEGEILNSKGEIVADIKSTHLGMGMFILTPVVGESYTAKMTLPSDTTFVKNFDLPRPLTSGCTLAVDVSPAGVAMCRVLATADIDPSALGMIVHSKGEVCHIGDRATSMRLSASSFNNGMATVSLVEKATMQTVCDRTFFVWNGTESTAEITSNSESYLPLSPVSLTLKFLDKAGEPLTDGSYSLSVVDSMWSSTHSTNIYASTLLSSELRGVVENPAYYFTDTDRAKLAKLDLVMMTHGWHRFEMDSVLLRRLRPYSFGHETVHTISGHLDGSRATMRNAYIAIMEPLYRASGKGFYKLYNLGDDPSFAFGIDNAPRGMNYILQAWTERGGKFGNTIELDPDNYPDWGDRRAVSRWDFGKKYKGIEQSDELDVTIDTTDVSRVVSIEAVAFSASVQRENYRPSIAVSEAHIAERKFETLGEVLDDFPGVYRMTSPEYGVVYLTAKESGVMGRMDTTDTSGTGLTPIKICVDGNPYVTLEHIDVDYIPLHAVKYVDYVGYPQCKDIFFSDHPVINVGMPVLYAFTSQKRGAITVVRKLGYSPDTTFYAPVYAPNTPRGSVADHRKTIHWEPYVNPDSTGIATIEFYTADRPSIYTITVEGVSCRGELLNATTQIKVER
ncbi:MAG: hypothetical protein J6V43_00420 [Rikenellaceae bacterium]|nr:hypothetical protein [Rikenellaceae bacterium]